MLLFDKAKSIFESEKGYVLESLENLKVLTPIQRFSVNMKMDSSISDDDELQKFKDNVKALTKGKCSHTYRGVADIFALFDVFPSLDEEFVELGMAAEVLHDVARHRQGLETGTHVDTDSYKKELHEKRGFSYPIAKLGITDHGRHGAYILKEQGLFNVASIPYIYQDVIYNVVKYHVIPNGLPFTIERLEEEVFNGQSLIRVLGNPSKTNKLMTLYYQAVKAVDDLDLHNKVLNGEIPILGKKTFGLDVNDGDNVRVIAERWGITEEQLREINKLTKESDLAVGSIVRIDPNVVPVEKFRIADDFAEMYYNDTLGTNLAALQNRPDYTFLYAQIFRLHTLRNIEFVPVLKRIQSSGMLDRIFDLYPDKYKPIMEPFFTFAKEEINERIEKAPSKVYALRTPNKK